MDKYEKGVILGRGTFASVYKAVHKEVRRGALRATNALSLSPGIATARASARSAGAAQRREVAIGCVVCCKKNARRARVQH